MPFNAATPKEEVLRLTKVGPFGLAAYFGWFGLLKSTDVFFCFMMPGKPWLKVQGVCSW